MEMKVKRAFSSAMVMLAVSRAVYAEAATLLLKNSGLTGMRNDEVVERRNKTI